MDRLETLNTFDTSDNFNNLDKLNDLDYLENLVNWDNWTTRQGSKVIDLIYFGSEQSFWSKFLWQKNFAQKKGLGKLYF